MPIGFSMATIGAAQFAKIIKKSMPSCCLPSARLASKCRAPLTHRWVHGGNAITASQFSSSMSRTSPV